MTKKITEGIIYVSPQDVEKLMADSNYVIRPDLCNDRRTSGYYIGKYCLSAVIIKGV